MTIKGHIQWIILTGIISSGLYGQHSVCKNYKKLSFPEKRWVTLHPFVAKKALNISIESRTKTTEIQQQQILNGVGNGDQLDAFRHVYWMARLVQEINWRKAYRLGKAHERGNYLQYKKGKLEDGVLPDKISTEMDLYNNNIGIEIGKMDLINNLEKIIIEKIVNGDCKIIKKDSDSNYLDSENRVISTMELIGRWENRKILINSNE